MVYTITLADGRMLAGLGKNGDNFVSAEKVDETIFKDNLSTMAGSDGETETVYHNVELIQQVHYSDANPPGWYLCFREKTAQELAMEQLDKTIRENALLAAQVAAASDRQEFLEDCIAEMAAQVYGA